MDGLRFVRDAHLSIAEGCYLPRADLLGLIQARLYEISYKNPELKCYLPNLLEVDLFVSWDQDKFLLLISSEKRAQLPSRGMDTKHLSSLREAGIDVFSGFDGFLDVSNQGIAKRSFEQLEFASGITIAGVFPASSYTEDAKAEKSVAADAVAKIIMNWAVIRRNEVENSRIFLSHKGINKPLVDKIDSALRLLNLKTWFDRDDLVAGDPLLRSVDNAFSSCAAAVFIISSDYVDSGVISKEIDRALHEQSMRSDSFRIIPLVLSQHGGNDNLVPTPLQTLTWKTVSDVEIVPSILKALPQPIQNLIKYSPQK